MLRIKRSRNPDGISF